MNKAVKNDSSHFGNFIFGCFGDEVTKILTNSLFIFHFSLPILPCKQKSLYRKSRNLSDEKLKSKLRKYVMSRALDQSAEPKKGQKLKDKLYDT